MICDITNYLAPEDEVDFVHRVASYTADFIKVKILEHKREYWEPLINIGASETWTSTLTSPSLRLSSLTINISLSKALLRCSPSRRRHRLRPYEPPTLSAMKALPDTDSPKRQSEDRPTAFSIRGSEHWHVDEDGCTPPHVFHPLTYRCHSRFASHPLVRYGEFCHTSQLHPLSAEIYSMLHR